MVLLTGPSGAGKSTLASLLQTKGWNRVDGDALAKSLYVPGSPLLRRLGKAFGRDIFGPDGSVDAGRLGRIVFSDAGRRDVLKRLVYGPFLRLLRGRLAEAGRKGGDWIVEVAVYFDMGAPDLGLPVALVTAPLIVRVGRLMGLGLGRARATARARSLRFGAPERRASALVLDGNGSPRSLLTAFQRGLQGPLAGPGAGR